MPEPPHIVYQDDDLTVFIKPAWGGNRDGNRRLRLDHVDDLVRRYQAGEGLMALAIAWDASSSVVRRELVERGVPIRGPSGPPPRRSAEEMEELAHRYRAGATFAALAKEQGISRERMRQILRRHGVTGAARTRSRRDAGS